MKWVLGLAAWVVGGCCLSGQTTQGLVSGVVLDGSGKTVDGARVWYCLLGTDGVIRDRGSAPVDKKNGSYVLPQLTPGDYRLRADAGAGAVRENRCFPEPGASAKFQAQEKHDLVLGVGARMEVNFELRPAADVWDKAGAHYLTPSGMVVRYFGTDQRTMQSGRVDTAPASQQSGGTTVSYDIDPRALERLPLTGRDVYALLTLMPGVTADTSTGRGLGLSVNGQRPSASNYMLDGVENNNNLVTGPLSAVAPEAVQEYRISTNNYSAEFGRTTGFLANAITRAPGGAWHGVGYLYGKHEKLNAADFQQNLAGYGRTPLREWQPGFSAGGPVVKERLFAGASLEYLRYRGRLDPQTVELPDGVPAGPIARGLLAKYPPPGRGTVTMAPSSTLDRVFGTPRVDYVSQDRKHRVMGRVAVADYDQPDAGWTPYKDFLTPLTQRSVGIAGSVTSELRPRLANEFRAGWTGIDIRFDSPHPEVPILVAGALQLPGPRAFLNVRDGTAVVQASDGLLWATRSHQVKVGGGFFRRRLNSYLQIAPRGYIEFADGAAFATDRPRDLIAPISRRELYASEGGRLDVRVPVFDRTYRATDLYFFAQDSVRVMRRLTLDYGVRYDVFGAPVNDGPAKDGLVRLGTGADFSARLRGAEMVFPGAGDQPLYSTDRGNWAGRSGFAYGIDQRSTLSLRGGFGIFYERPFDNLWANIRNNSVVLTRQPAAADYLTPVGEQIRRLEFPAGTRASSVDNVRFIRPTLYQPELRNGYTSSYYVSLQKQVSPGLSVEINGLGARGRRLIATDWVNRARSIPFGSERTNPVGYLTLRFPEISYRSNQGNSEYAAMTTVVRYRSTRGFLQVSHSWSHSIDNQSDPLTGEFDLSLLRTGASGLEGIAGFTRQFDSRVDRGNSDFDQRQNLVLFTAWDVPALFQATGARRLFTGWRVAGVAAVRSGLPFTVFSFDEPGFTGETMINNRASLIDPGRARTDRPADGGRLLLNPTAFRYPESGAVGTTGRNAFAGPGFFSADISVSRAIRVPGVSDRARALLRADVFNVLNHANLSNPGRVPFCVAIPDLPCPAGFGFAAYGRGESSSVLIAGPLRETARRVQMLLRLEF